ncbi:hypothetical protein BJ508DRAFT_302588 [Ascobolus immersus RN42]|uniref:Uncharacterized protein n=1 Tax=Ascobolus immersus RN42 TaxID=1160509 RepID=A0A3N4IIT8_ASCIM|nr:hypothetical protein BJ508DRAFT_302588 [Ascobolus immersus RN42]
MFWDTMELWQKMLFVLACAIVITLFIAMGKLIRDKLKLNKHVKATAQRKVELESQNAESQVNIVVKEKDDIPFGIKALEAGIEVEGVVVSRPQTPMRRSVNPSAVTLPNSIADLESGLQTGTSTPRSSMNHPSLSHLSMIMREQANNSPMRPVVYQPSPYLSFPAPVYSNSHLSSARSSVSSQTSSPSLSRQNSKELKGGVNGSDQSLPRPPMFTHRSTNSSGGLPAPDLATLMRLTGRPSIDSRTNSNPELPVVANGRQVRHSRTPSPPETSLKAVREGEMMDSDASTSGTETDNSLGLANRPRPPRAKSVPLNAIAGLPTGQTKLSMLDTHRLSHAAEVGQIKRKVRGPTTSQYYSRTNSRENNIHLQDTVQAYGLDSSVPMQSQNGTSVSRSSSDPTRPEFMYMVDGPADRAAPSDWALQSLRDAGIADSLSGTSSVETLSRNNSSNNGSVTSYGGDQAEGRADGAVSEGLSNDSEQSQPEKSKRKKLVKRSRASSVSSSEAASNKV